jgi:hypothetical protein
VRKTNSLAIVSLVFGLAAWFALPVVASIVAIITGHLARRQIRDGRGLEDGDGLALGGLVLGYLHLAVVLLTVIVIVGLVVAGVGVGFLASLGHW